jgi:D-alanine-D-alanine ligase
MKLTVGVVFGGRSGEHEVSLVSATSIIKAMAPEKYEIVEIGITHEGKWMVSDIHSGRSDELGEEGCLEQFKKKKFGELREAFLSTDPDKKGIVYGDSHFQKIDVMFPVLHGPFGEDGTIQGLFEMLNMPYVGCGVLASSTAMDKLQCKALWEAAGLPVVPYVGFTRAAWDTEKETILKDIRKNIGIPCFVKPANMGSSVGITKVKEDNELESAIDEAAKYDRRILVEISVDAREIECAVLGNDDPIASPAGEVIVGGEFYDYHDKYVNGVSTTQIPADITEEASSEIREICVKAYKLLDCAGLSRVDSFLDRKSGAMYLNEINTLPGFTSISMYPKMMEAHGMSYEQLIDKLIELGMERYEDKKKNKVSFDSGSEWFKG